MTQETCKKENLRQDQSGMFFNGKFNKLDSEPQNEEFLTWSQTDAFCIAEIDVLW